MSTPVRIALCDDHAVLRAGLTRLLLDEPDFEVVGEAGTADEAVTLAKAQAPDVFVLDLGLPGDNGFSAIPRILEASPDTRVLILTMHDDLVYLRQAFEAGASGYVIKSAVDVELVLAVRAVAAGGRYVHPSMGAALLDQPPTHARPSPTPSGLSPREIEVLQRLAAGHTNAEIARELSVSVRTVETHRAHIQQKLGLRTRADLARYFREQGLED